MNEAMIHDLASSPMTTATISKGGQISVPAEVRRRWATTRVSVHDLGDQLLVRPIPDDPIGAALGSLALPADVTTDALRDEARRDEAETEARRRPAR